LVLISLSIYRIPFREKTRDEPVGALKIGLSVLIKKKCKF